MGLLTKKDLEDRGAYEYTWTTTLGDNPHITGKTDSGRVNRKEGYEVLDLINDIAKKFDFRDKESGFKLEDMIHTNTDVMREKVKGWIVANWETFKAK
ncbi:MAG: hypothetical protein WBH99_04000 [Azovibrio sp.]|uniref:hypothetical protein n=1 Tax=Azovibrio sp. TaxID=1872673 RepID=UPI003C77763C